MLKEQIFNSDNWGFGRHGCMRRCQCSDSRRHRQFDYRQLAHLPFAFR